MTALFLLGMKLICLAKSKMPKQKYKIQFLKCRNLHIFVVLKTEKSF